MSDQILKGIDIMAATPPYTADENDANLSWTAQDGTVMPSPYSSTFGNPIDVDWLPSLAKMQELKYLANTTDERTYYFRFCNLVTD